MSPSPKYLYLTTTGRLSGRPRRIEIWFTRQEGRYYLVAEHGRRVLRTKDLESTLAALRDDPRFQGVDFFTLHPRVEGGVVRIVAHRRGSWLAISVSWSAGMDVNWTGEFADAIGVAAHDPAHRGVYRLTLARTVAPLPVLRS